MAHVKEEPIPDVGVLVGRFQVPEMHEGHRDVLDYVASRHDDVILLLGNTAHGISTPANPLDFKARKQMIEAEYPEFTIQYIGDEQSDEYWSKKLDNQIRTLAGPMQTVMLYGSRDSFLDHYVGNFPTQQLEAEYKVSGTEIRAEIKRKRPVNSVDYRMGVVASAWAHFPVTYPTVDIAIFNEELDSLVLAKKPNEALWRLPGGFAEPHSESYEADARREAMEETNLTITDPVYIGSLKVDDWRYRAERDKIKTLLFVAKKQFGGLNADDDVEFAEWLTIGRDLDRFTLNGEWVESMVMDNHIPLVNMAIRKKDVLK